MANSAFSGEDSVEEGPSESGVAVLLDQESTTDLHDDTTILRGLKVLDDQSLQLFDALRLWAGGAIQYDYYRLEDVYSYSSNGESQEGGSVRRMEGTLRAQLYDWGELKAQYDFDSGTMRDLYLRWVSPRINTPLTITAGNQKEPMGLDLTMGNKFALAQESSAPSDAFGDWRSLGVRIHRAFQTDRRDRKLDLFDDDAAFVTTSLGVFTEDLEESHETDLALTGRITAGRERAGVGMHLGVSASYREGVFDRVRFRPEINEADRITLAQPQANTAGITGLEAAYNHGPLHLQAEAYYARYQGRIDGYGGGGYLQAGWFITGESRDYNARWGVLAPHKAAGSWSAEVFARLSHTRGEDDINGWNDYRSATLGANLYYRQLRLTLNLLNGELHEPVNGQDDGLALNVRAQYLF